MNKPNKGDSAGQKKEPTQLTCLGCNEKIDRCKHCEEWDEDDEALFVWIAHCEKCGLTMRMKGEKK